MNRLIRCAARGCRNGGQYAMTAAACAVASVSAHAGDFSIGAGAGVDRGKADCVDAYPCDRSDAFGKLFAGYRFDSGLELQALAFDAGRFKGGDTTSLGTSFGGRFKVSGMGLAAGYRWGFAPDWSLKGQAGVASVRTRFDYVAPYAGDPSKTTTQPLLGLSLAWQIAPKVRLSLDYDETRFKVYTSHGSLQMLGVAAQFSF